MSEVSLYMSNLGDFTQATYPGDTPDEGAVCVRTGSGTGPPRGGKGSQGTN